MAWLVWGDIIKDGISYRNNLNNTSAMAAFYISHIDKCDTLHSNCIRVSEGKRDTSCYTCRKCRTVYKQSKKVTE